MIKTTYSLNKINSSKKLSIRRRDVTRSSGYKSHPDATGGELQYKSCESYILKKGHSLNIYFNFDNLSLINNKFVGVGGWFYSLGNIQVSFSWLPNIKYRNIEIVNNDWNAIGSIYQLNNENILETCEVKFYANEDSIIAFYEINCGIIYHKHIDDNLKNKPSLLSNLYSYSPEANFITEKGNIYYNSSYSREKQLTYIDLPSSNNIEIMLKSCNRCARYLPINYPNEKHHLSFSNHCVSRAPCKHSGFGKLRITNNDERSNDYLNLYFGFQLECRFCKKFEVNAAHNPQRTSDQMKEDGLRRRNFELLLSQLFNENPQIKYRENTGRELTTDIWEKFKRKCFKCNKPLSSPKDMHLDHTRPLALLWPLDETATCLCKDCNLQKHDKYPNEFYTLDELEKLSKLTGISIAELQNKTPNLIAVEKIFDNLNWLINDFCKRQDLVKSKSGKIPAELLLKSLQRVIDMTNYKNEYDLIELFRNSL